MTLPVLECLLPQQWQWQLPDTTLFLLVLLPLLLTLVLGTIRSFYTKGRHLHLPPGPRKLPVVGNLHQILGSLPHRSLRDLARRHGPVMLLRLGTVPTVVVSSAAAAREVMKTHDGDCCSRPDTPGPRRLSYGLKDVAFAPYDEYWREMRKLFIVELLSMRRVKAAWHAREAQVDKLICKLSSFGGKQVFVEDHIFGLMDGIIGTVAFGNIYGTDQFVHKKHFHDVVEEAMGVMASFSTEDYFPNAAGRLVDYLTGVVSRRERVFRELDAFFDMIIEQHLDASRATANNDLVDILIGLMEEEYHKHQGSDLKFSRDHIKALLQNTFIGGVDTSSVTMIWAMAELIRKPWVLKKVQDEIRATVGDKARVHPDDMPKLRYLKMVVKETLRLHPALPLLVPRETLRPVSICGYQVPAKTRLLVNAWAIGRDPATWDNPEEFDPDRFEFQGKDDVDFNGAHFELVPFGAGRRMCPGMALGVASMEFTLANLLCCFDWALPEGMAPEDVSMEEAGGLTVHKKTPLVLVPTRYTRHY